MTSTLALTNATLPYLLHIAYKGWKAAALEDSAIAKGLNVVEGEIVCKPVAKAFGLPFRPVETVLA